ncbi:MAG: hypothetical protein BME94_02455 [Methanobacteriales archaeon Met13]
MKSLEYESKMDNKKKVKMVTFWVNRKAARIEGCAPFLIKKISTSMNTHLPDETKLLKFDEKLMEEIVADLEDSKTVKFNFNIGEEVLDVSLSNDSFSVSVIKSPEIEDEIIEKLEMELPKKFPSVCDSFTPRVTPHE